MQLGRSSKCQRYSYQVAKSNSSKANVLCDISCNPCHQCSEQSLNQKGRSLNRRIAWALDMLQLDVMLKGSEHVRHTLHHTAVSNSRRPRYNIAGYPTASLPQALRAYETFRLDLHATHEQPHQTTLIYDDKQINMAHQHASTSPGIVALH